MRDSEDIARTMRLHADTVARVCSVYFGRRPEADDAFQDTFIRYAQSDKEFEGDEHRKAWLIHVASNVCKDLLKRASERVIPVGEFAENASAPWQPAGQADGQPGIESGNRADTLNEALAQLDEKYRLALYLKYYEGYTAAQISDLTGVPENTVYTNLARGREKLKEVLVNGQ